MTWKYILKSNENFVCVALNFFKCCLKKIKSKMAMKLRISLVINMYTFVRNSYLIIIFKRLRPNQEANGICFRSLRC